MLIVIIVVFIIHANNKDSAFYLSYIVNKLSCLKKKNYKLFPKYILTFAVANGLALNLWLVKFDARNLG